MAGAVRDFGGEVPRRDARLLPDSMAATAWNCDVSAGTLAGLPKPELVKDLTAVSGTVLRAYRLPAPVITDPDAWLPLPSPYSSVVRSPLTNDALHRVYWTSPGEGGLWSDYARIIADDDPFTLGTIQPDGSFQPTVTASGGTPSTSVPYVSRSYLVTFINSFGEESAPSLPSAVIDGASDGTWTVFMPNLLPGQPAGKNYDLPTHMRLYRTITGQSTGAAFYEVIEFDMAVSPPSALGWVDATLDGDIVNNQQLESTAWGNPPDGLDGLTLMAGGFMVGFTDNTLHFSEPNRPHAWPASYDLSVGFPIIGLAVWQQSLMVLTSGFPSQGSGTSPLGFSLSTIQVSEPCVSRGSIVVDLLGVYYASQNGLVQLNYYGINNQTQPIISRKQWLSDFEARNLIACRHRTSQFLAVNGTGEGFLVDTTEGRQGVMRLNTFYTADCVWNDNYTGDSYIMAEKIVYRWDSPDAEVMNFRWRSKVFNLPAPKNLGAAQINAAPGIGTVPGTVTLPPLDNTDPLLVLPDGENCVFKVWADGALVFTRNIREPIDIFTMKAGFLAFEWQFEILSRVEIYSVELAANMRALKNA